VRYVSTRGRAPELGFADVLLAGLAADGGLYVPGAWPQLPTAEALDACSTYSDTAAAILTPFVGDAIAGDDLASMCADAYAAFRHAAVVPLVQVAHRHWLAELYHGPTLAFKDVALQLVGRLFDHVLAERGERVTVVGATSGDTGPAAIEGVRGCDRVDIVILYPHGGTSEVQRRQMTTVDAPNVRAVAIEGTFDDCQDLVKAMFNDAPFRQRHNLSAVNSINWARVMAQAVYFVTTARALRVDVTACVPTGNFGNLFAGWVARRMGAPIRDFIVSSNANDILTRFINDGDMSIRPVITTTSPSMDIQVSSNFERLLFEINRRDGLRTGEQLVRFRQSGRLDVAPEARAEWIDGQLRAARFDDGDVAAEIGRMYGDTGLLIDPHTATAAAAARRFGGSNGGVPIVTMAAAHPAKFPDVVERATGVRPQLPPHLADLYEREEHSERLPNDLAAVEDYVAVTFR
jgi:threonine synthase